MFFYFYPRQKEFNLFTTEYLIMRKFLIVGLGNIGLEYENTRHNIGFKVLEQLAQEKEAEWKTERLGDMAIVKHKGRTFYLLKPNTFMNLSGKAVKYWVDKENFPLESILVVTDDLNLPFGSIRIKARGSDGGHNGLKDIQDKLNTTQYPRFRFGIGSEFGRGRQVNYVLGEWDEEEQTKLKERLEASAKAILSFGLAGINTTMNSYNGK